MYEVKPLSYRQFTILRTIFERGGIKLHVALALYKSTVVSLFNRGYLKIQWTGDERVMLTNRGLHQMRCFKDTPLSDLAVKNNPPSRQAGFVRSLKHKK